MRKNEDNFYLPHVSKNVKNECKGFDIYIVYYCILNKMSKFIRYFCCYFKSYTSNLNTPLISELTLEEKLSHATWKTCKPFIPPISSGKVIKVYDGDTITIATKLPYDNELYRFSVRLNGIDSAEIKGKTEHERQIASLARDALIGKILGKMVELRNIGTEKYGRILADVYLGDLHINNWMLENNYAIVYNGGTKVIQGN
jgi:endonuclease YncB( thermonuclease family)